MWVEMTVKVTNEHHASPPLREIRAVAITEPHEPGTDITVGLTDMRMALQKLSAEIARHTGVGDTGNVMLYNMAVEMQDERQAIQYPNEDAPRKGEVRYVAENERSFYICGPALPDLDSDFVQQYTAPMTGVIGVDGKYVGGRYVVKTETVANWKVISIPLDSA